MIKKGLLSDYFAGVAVKRLSAVEASPARSNQHEFNGVAKLRAMLGILDRREIPARYLWLGDEQEGIGSDGIISWYDARRAHETRTEFRLYYQSNEVTSLMEEGNAMFLALCRDGSAVVVITEAGGSMESQLTWLFGMEAQPELSFAARTIESEESGELDFAARYLLDELGIEFEEPDGDRLDEIIAPFGTSFPTTQVFSELARNSLPDIEAAIHDPDIVLVSWLEREKALFRRLERRVVSDRLASGFAEGGEPDVDSFLKYSLSVQNRRKSRAGQSLENHLEAIFSARGLRYVRGATTENGNKPDFLFPSVSAYNDSAFPSEKLTMLGAKSTLKDRWRQVLPEARRIESKHLLTLEPAISERQTEQMKAERLQLVVPAGLHSTYTASQAEWLMRLSDFIELVRDREMTT